MKEKNSLDPDERRLAEFIQPTTSGRWLNIQYQLEIKQDFEGICWSENPHWTLPLFLQPPFLPSYGRVQEPQGWSPVIYDPRVIDIIYQYNKLCSKI